MALQKKGSWNESEGIYKPDHELIRFISPQTSYGSCVVQSQAVNLWSILTDSTSKKLSCYGDLTPEESK